MIEISIGWFVFILLSVAGLFFLAGRHNGIMTFDNAMVKAGKLPPREKRDDD